MKSNKYTLLLFAALFTFISITGYAQKSKIQNDYSWMPVLPKYTDLPLDSVIRTDFTVTMRDGVIIDCLKYIPFRAAPPAGGYPTVIMVHGYGDNKNTLAAFCHDQATFGYYTMTFSVRGQGNSGGLSNLISDIEALDMLEIIQAVKNDSIHGSSPSKILIMGGSQGGALPMKAICMGGNPVATIISALAPPTFASSWIENGSIKMTALWTMDYTPDTARYTQEVINMRNWIFADTKAGWDSLARVLPRGRDFVTSLPNCRTPVFVEGCWQDKFFNASGWLDNITALNVPMTSYFGAVQGHGGDHSVSEDNWHMNWFNNWFFQWLWGMNTGILDAPKYQYASTTLPVVNNYLTFVHDSSRTPLNNISTNMRLYFAGNKKLKTSPGSGNVTLNNTVKTGYKLSDAINTEFTGSTFSNNFTIGSITFESDPLSANVKWTGTPKITMNYSSTASTFCQFNFQIWEVASDGTSRFINRVNYTDRNYIKGQKRSGTFRGQAHSHIFKSGSKIRIVVTNLDRVSSDSSFFGTNPFVLPVMNNGIHTIYFNSNAYIDFPVVNSSADVTDLFSGAENKINSNEPLKSSLAQNYPNPFNPSTSIVFSIASPGIVKLNVYDVLGRLVKTIVNENKSAGSYNVNFDASELSSGVYFYKLETNSFTDIKRMILVK